MRAGARLGRGGAGTEWRAVGMGVLARGQLRVVLGQYAPEVPGLFLYFPSRAQVSPALEAFVDVAREVTSESSPTK